MKIILNEQVPHVGEKKDIVDVASGYAQNFLIPRGLARRATDADVVNFEANKAQREERRKQEESDLIESLQKVNEETVTVSTQAGEAGHLYAGLHAVDILDVINEQTGQSFKVDHLHFDEPIKEVGNHAIEIRVADKKAHITLSVSSPDA